MPSPGEYRTWETLAANLKRMVADRLCHLPPGLARVMQEFEDHDTAILWAVQTRTLDQIGTEIDLCVRSFQHCAAARATQSPASEGFRMAIFDQRGQHVLSQYNAAGDINFGAVQNRMEVVGELEKLQAELRQALQAGLLDEDVATDADYQLTKAVQQAKKPAPDKKTLLEHLHGVKTLIEGVAAANGLVSALTKAVEVVQQLF